MREDAVADARSSLWPLTGWAAWGVCLGMVLALLISASAHSSSSKKVGSADETSTWVMRPDGSKSCEGEPPEQSMAAWTKKLEAAGVRVLKTAKGEDGKMHVMMCGAPTGRVDLFLIPAGRWAEVEAMGFLRATPEIVASAIAAKKQASGAP